MTILFTGRKTDCTADLRELAEHKLGKLEPILHENPDAHVILTREKHRHLAEIVVHARIGTLTARANGTEFPESLGQAIDRLLAQARKQHSKIAKGRKRRAMKESPRRGSGYAPGPEVPPLDGPPIVDMGRVRVRAMSVEDAVRAAQEAPEPFVVYRDADTGRLSVVFRRRDGRFGRLEPET